LDSLAIPYLLLRHGVPTEEDLYLQFCREYLRFVEILEGSGPETARIFRRDESGASLRLLCMDPSGWMRTRFADFVGGVLLSATLKPAEYHVDLLGLGDRVRVADFPSHFPTENRGVVLATGVSTAYRDREPHKEATAQLIREVLEATPGNSAVYYSSYAMLRSLCPLTEVEGRQSLVQTRNLDDAARAALVASLVSTEGDKVLHAVLGGVFAEGVDLPVGVLSSVVVVGPAYPQVGLERDFIRRWCEEKYGRGFDYAFLIPGMNRVVQAAGRIIRSQEDRGMVILVGRRFGWSQSRELLPQEWASQSSKTPADAVRAFWESSAESG
jgi:DNA excision repair protein ERCC-2